MKSFEENISITSDVWFLCNSALWRLSFSYAVCFANMMSPIVILSGLNSYVFCKVSADVLKPENYCAFDPY